eukprot:SAG11_NODE_829_length_6967_cov_7.039196_7_plen_247_part_00
MQTLVPAPAVPVLYRYLWYRYGIMTAGRRSDHGGVDTSICGCCLEPHTVGTVSSRRFHRCQNSKSVIKSHLGVHGPSRLICYATLSVRGPRLRQAKLRTCSYNCSQPVATAPLMPPPPQLSGAGSGSAAAAAGLPSMSMVYRSSFAVIHECSFDHSSVNTPCARIGHRDRNLNCWSAKPVSGAPLVVVVVVGGGGGGGSSAAEVGYRIGAPEWSPRSGQARARRSHRSSAPSPRCPPAPARAPAAR